MKKVAIGILLLTLILSVAAFGQDSVMVTFLANTATVPDTMQEYSTVQIRGSGGPLTWDHETGVVLTSIGGDYWKGTAKFPASSDVEFKFFTNVDTAVGQTHPGWEAGNNRTLATGTTDTTLVLQFVNGVNGEFTQYFRPYTETDDSVEVWIRVNMQGNENFNPNNQYVGVRGAAWPDYLGYLSWNHTYFLKRESSHANTGQSPYNGGYFWSGVVRFAKSEVTEGQKIEYKYVIAGSTDPDAEVTWESVDNKSFNIPTAFADTTLHWVYWDNSGPVARSHADEVFVNYSVDMTNAINNNGFSFGDTIIARAGYFGSASEVYEVTLMRQGFGKVYTGIDTINTTVGENLSYQYYLLKWGGDVRENYYNFDYKGDVPSEAERRLITVSGTALTISDTDSAKTSARRMPLFRNQNVLSQDVLVTFRCDLRPAYYQVIKGTVLNDIQGQNNISTTQQIDDLGLYINGPAVGGWGTWSATGLATQKMFDDGTNGDVTAGDSVFAFQVTYYKDSSDVVGQEFKFGIGGGDNEGGEGGYGNNHIENIDDTNPTDIIDIAFGSINPTFYNAWDYETSNSDLPDSVTVTFIANTATVPDTMQENSTVQIRGSGGPLTWDHETGVVLTNIGGDLWKGSAKFPVNSNIEFKFFTNVDTAVGQTHPGWEAGNNRTLTTTYMDTTLDLQFVNGVNGEYTQYFRPCSLYDDSLEVWIRVNMHGNENFNPNNQYVGVRGAAWPDYLGYLSWNHTYFLKRESSHANTGQSPYNGGHFWSGVVRFAKSEVNEGDKIEYKFVIAGSTDPDAEVTWESVDNKSFNVPVAYADTTLHWVYWDNTGPVARTHADEVVVNYSVDLTSAINNNGFAFGDTIVARAGFFGTASEVYEVNLMRQGFGKVYTAIDTIKTTVGANLSYQYYLLKWGGDVRENYYNFDYKGDVPSEAERRLIAVSSTSLSITDTDSAKTSARRMPLFRNQNVLAQDVVVTIRCDLRPAYYQVIKGSTLDDIQGQNNISTTQQIDDLGLYINGPAVGGWGTWSATGIAAQKMFDDGTNGDLVAGDSIFAFQVSYYKDSSDVVGQEFKFGIGGGDNEGGEGGYGNNHIENIDDTNPTDVIEVAFGSINPTYFNAWDFETNSVATGITSDEISNIPKTFYLKQNYPNPFNPETTIKFGLPRQAKVKIEIYNILGQRVRVLLNKEMEAGAFKATWNGRNDLGLQVTSGVYIYRIVSRDFIKTRKMVFIK